ncbi:MAG: hydrogenase expression/formation C-terminal domain-containing protein [Gammaproteobacteria bacterium]|nr:hydrogenase expression/formation C-terminal domain-containing protein [Gammaproteobacteria bacterium]
MNRPENASSAVEALLCEVRVALRRLAEAAEPTTIDLGPLPLSPAEFTALERALGEGEVTARLDALGTTSVRETAVPGVWWVTHDGCAGRVAGPQLEVARWPALLETPAETLRSGLASLDALLDASQERPTPMN